jgi:hypothetical protein
MLCKGLAERKEFDGCMVSHEVERVEGKDVPPWMGCNFDEVGLAQTFCNETTWPSIVAVTV